MFFVSYVNTYKPFNAACKEIAEWATSFRNVLIKDECSLDALHAEIDKKITEINSKYPKVKRFNVNRYDDNLGVKVYAGDNSDYNNVFVLSIHKVRGTYEFSECSTLKIGGCHE